VDRPSFAAVHCRVLIVVFALACSGAGAASDGPPLPGTKPLTGTRVTFKATDATIADCVKQLNATSENKLEIAPPQLLDKPPLSERRISVDFNDRPWLAAAHEIARAAELSVQVLGGDNRSTLVAGNAANLVLRVPTAFAGPLAVTCHAATVESGVKFGEPALFTHTVELQLTVMSEPIHPLLACDSMAGLVAAADENAAPLAVAATEPRWFSVSGRQLRLPITLPAGSVKRLSRVDALVGVYTVAAASTLEIPDLLNGTDASIAFAGGTVRVVDLKQVEGGMYEFKLLFSGGELNGREVTSRALAQLRMIGSKYTPRTSGEAGRSPRVLASGSVDGVTSVTMQVAPAAGVDVGALGRPVTSLTWLMPTTVQRHVLPITLEDITLWR
jgi:hypothetical protein